MASKADIATILETFLWSNNDNSTDTGGEPLDENYSARDVDDDTVAKLSALVDALYQTAEVLGVTVDDKAVHRSYLDATGHGTGLWDDYLESWAGQGKAWSDALRATDAGKALRDSCAYVGDDGKIHVG